MATTQKKTTQKSASSSAKQSASAGNKRAEALARNKRRRNIWSVVLFAIGILMLAFAFIGDSNAENPNAWDAIHSFFCGIFGIAVFFIGPIFISVAIMISLDKGKSTVSAKLFQMILFVFLFSAAIQILFVGKIGDENAGNFFEVIGQVYSNGTQLSGGGVCSMLLGFPLLLLGRVGASIIIILIIFVVVMLIANISLMDFLSLIAKPFKKLGRYIKAKREEYAEESEYVREERAIKEQQRIENKQLIDEQKRAKKLSEIEALGNSLRSESNDSAEDNAAELSEIDSETSEQLVKDQHKDTVDFQSKLRDLRRGALVDDVPPAFPEGEQLTTETVQPEEIHEQIENPVDEAIEEYKQETEEKSESVDASETPAAEEKTLGTVITSDEDGQQRIEEIIASAEQYKLPPIDLLNDIVKSENQENLDNEIQHNAETLVSALKSFGVQTKFLEAVRGPSVTRYELQPAPGVKIAKITGLVDDIALNLATAGVRIEAPIPNKAAVGIEVPNKEKETVFIREMIDSEAFKNSKSKLGSALGKNISGEVVICDIAEMPHILIAGTTGAGKSVCVNSIIMSILFRSTPDEVRLLMIDPKAVEFMIYNGIPHLLIPVVTDPKKAAGALGWAVQEMDKRYKLLGENNVRDIASYNKLAKNREDLQPMPQIVIFIDELADLMMTSKNEVEASICRLAQKARAAGMHLVVATQRPSVDVITGLIKSNIPSRIALKVASQVDSRTIMDTAGAEKLLGKGDMLYKSVAMPKPMRVQGCWVSDTEVERVTSFIKNSFILQYDESVIEEVERQAERVGDSKGGGEFSGDLDVNDEKLEEAIEVVINEGQASTSKLQRFLQVGYGRAAKLIDIMENMGIVGPPDGNKPRQILITKEEWYERKLNKNQ